MDEIKIISVEEIEEEVEVYDITVEEDRSFLVEGIFVHNCIRCGGLDGKIYRYQEGVADHNGPMIPVHPRCRCVYIPITKSWKELGINAKEFPRGTRASFSGQVLDTMTYSQWLKTQPVAIQKDLLGARYELWESGKLRLDQMVKDKKILSAKKLNEKFEKALKKEKLIAGFEPIPYKNVIDDILDKLTVKVTQTSAEEEILLALTGEGKKVVFYKGNKLASAMSWSIKGENLVGHHLGSLQRHGGSRAILAMVDDAIKHKVNIVFESTPEAIGLYERIGFVQDRVNKQLFETPYSELKIIKYRLEKILSKT